MNYIRWFQEIRTDQVELVGGKGANLGEMVNAGLPVPPGFCLIAPAYQAFVESAGLKEQITRVLSKADIQDPADVEAKTARIRALIKERSVPRGIAQQVLASYDQLNQELGLSQRDQVPVAVRSSATAEDLPDASFAGQQDTYLNVRGEEALLEHISRCWASLWTARAVIYRTQQGFDHRKVYLSVVIQSMIPSEVSGILFTANPVSGNRNEAVINASWGLGEAIVSGLVSPDTITAKKDDGSIVSYELGGKELTIEYDREGGIVELETPKDRREAPVLSDRQVADLVDLGRQIEDHYGHPQDIEWAYAHGRWYLLQARPITTLKLQATTGHISGDFNRTMFIEIFPDPLSPVFLSVVKPLFKSMLDFTFRTLGFKPPRDTEAIGIFYNQPYFNRRYIEKALDPLSPAVRNPLVAQIVNPFGHQEQRLSGEFSRHYLGMIARTLNFMIRFPKKLPGFLGRYRAEVAQVAALSSEKASDAEIVTQIQRLVLDSARRLLDYDFLMIAVIGRTYRILGSLLEQYYDQDTDEVVAKLISGVTGNVTMETNKRLWDLAVWAKSSPEVTAVLKAYPASKARAYLEQTAEAEEFLGALDRFLSEYGHREIRMDILYPTWGEDPTPVFGFVRSYLDTDEEQSPHRQQGRLVQERQELTKEVLDRVVQRFWGRYVLAPIVRWMLRQTQVHTRERDTMHFELTRLFPPFRRLLLELGRRWKDQKLIDRQEDIFFLGLDEMAAIAESPRSYIEEVRARREEFEANQSRPWPDIVRDGQEVYAERGDITEAPEGGLAGIAGSPGLVSGISRIIRGPEEFHKLQKGDILVAPLTNPVWTPLFAVAGGVVTEVGGILSHGAIVAREYGIPAVMSVASATSRLVEGQSITVDGNKGVVYLQTRAET